jgi:general secretion pathway protein G
MINTEYKYLPIKRKSVSGFTLIEIMVVVVILGILASLIVPKIMSRPEQARTVKAKQDIRAIETALELYKLDNGFYPSTDQGLQSLVKQPTTSPVPANWKIGGYLREVPMDPWNRPYQYLNPGSHSEIDIYSFGAEGPNSSATIIGNWSTRDDASSS